jgi:hypothetical protein
VIDHRDDCNGQPCTCGAALRAFLKRNPPMQGPVIAGNPCDCVNAPEGTPDCPFCDYAGDGQ